MEFRYFESHKKNLLNLFHAPKPIGDHTPFTTVLRYFLVFKPIYIIHSIFATLSFFSPKQAEINRAELKKKLLNEGA